VEGSQSSMRHPTCNNFEELLAIAFMYFSGLILLANSALAQEDTTF